MRVTVAVTLFCLDVAASTTTRDNDPGPEDMHGRPSDAAASSSATSSGAASSAASSGAASSAAYSGATFFSEDPARAFSLFAVSDGEEGVRSPDSLAVGYDGAAYSNVFGDFTSSFGASDAVAPSSATSGGAASFYASSGVASSSPVSSFSSGGSPSTTSNAGIDVGFEDVEHNLTCVPYNLCKAGDIIVDGARIIHFRFDPDGGNSPCPNFLEVPCSAPLTEPNSEVIGRIADPEYVPSCGHRNPEGLGITVEGFQNGESQFGEYPWMAIILENEAIGHDQVVQRFVCGGSLIHQQVIMTGAHCVTGKDMKKLRVRLGDWDTQNEKEIFPYEEHRVAHVELHKRFHSINLRYDVALLFLEEPVELKQHIDTLCLPDENENFDYLKCVATGYGKDQFDGGRFQNILKQVDLPVVPHRKCQTRLRGTRLGRWFRLHPSFTCAGGEVGMDTCRGDGGSPLACPSKDDPSKYVQVGIVAWGIGCGEEGVPGVYASVPKLVKWVNEKMADHFRNVLLTQPNTPNGTSYDTYVSGE